MFSLGNNMAEIPSITGNYSKLMNRRQKRVLNLQAKVIQKSVTMKITPLSGMVNEIMGRFH